MKHVIISTILLLCSFLLCNNSHAQEETACLRLLNYYTSYLEHDDYNNALINWRKSFFGCPVRIGHKFYSDGADIYRYFASKASRPSQALLDTLVLLNAARGYIYPKYQLESSRTIETDIARFASDNEQLRMHLLEEIRNVEEFLNGGANKRFTLYEGRIIRVAIANPRVVSGTALSTIENSLIKGEISQALSRSQDYNAYTRTDIDKLLEEHNFQSTGMVSESERHEIGKMSGVDFICSINVTKESNSIFIEASLLNIKTGEIRSSSSGYCEYSSINDAFALEVTCKKIGQELAGNTSYRKIKLIPSKGGLPQKSKPYLETAFGIDMQLVYIKGGIFGEGTEREEYVEPFYLSTFLVTQSQWLNVMGSTQEELLRKCVYFDTGNSNGAMYPVYCVTPEDALDFCKALSSMSGLKYDLPTAIEWEMASNKPSESYKYSGSDKISEVGWTSKAMPVGLKKPNSYKIYDMTGNVAEFCRNNDGFVIKGGTPWGNYDVSTRYIFKDIMEDASSPFVGFRIIMRVPTEE